nr:ribosomal protein subunit S13 [Ipomoea trifida]
MDPCIDKFLKGFYDELAATMIESDFKEKEGSNVAQYHGEMMVNLGISPSTKRRKTYDENGKWVGTEPIMVKDLAGLGDCLISDFLDDIIERGKSLRGLNPRGLDGDELDRLRLLLEKRKLREKASESQEGFKEEIGREYLITLLLSPLSAAIELGYKGFEGAGLLLKQISPEWQEGADNITGTNDQGLNKAKQVVQSLTLQIATPDRYTTRHWIGFHDKGVEGVYVVVVEVLTGGDIRIRMTTIVPTANEGVLVSIRTGRANPKDKEQQKRPGLSPALSLDGVPFTLLCEHFIAMPEGARSVVNAQVRSASKRIYGIGPIKAILVRYRFLVGTAETTTTCPATFPKSFCEWLGGIIDGDGFFDADGHIGINMRNPPRGPELRIVVTNKLRQDVESWKEEEGEGLYEHKDNVGEKASTSLSFPIAKILPQKALFRVSSHAKKIYRRTVKTPLDALSLYYYRI